MSQKTAHDVLEDIKRAMGSDEVRLWVIPMYFQTNPNRKEAVQVQVKNGAGRWTKVGPVLFPPDEGTTADTVAMLMEFREEGR